MFKRILFVLLLATNADACWYQSKKPALDHIRRYLQKIGKNPAFGIERCDLQSVMDGLPAAARWIINKVGSVDGVLRDCDMNKDGTITFFEGERAGHCMESCCKFVVVFNLFFYKHH